MMNVLCYDISAWSFDQICAITCKVQSDVTDIRNRVLSWATSGAVLSINKITNFLFSKKKEKCKHIYIEKYSNFMLFYVTVEGICQDDVWINYNSLAQSHILFFVLSSVEVGGDWLRNFERGDVSLGLFCGNWIRDDLEAGEVEVGVSKVDTSGLGEHGKLLLVDGVGEALCDALGEWIMGN